MGFSSINTRNTEPDSSYSNHLKREGYYLSRLLSVRIRLGLYQPGMLTGRRCIYMKKPLKLPKFKNEDEEREFWYKLDLSEYYEASDLERVSFPNLKPTSKPVSIRIPEYLLNRVKEKANETNIPYQSLIKEYIKKGVLSS